MPSVYWVLAAVDLSNKTVLITGASSGIGRACAVSFAKRGARLILTARHRPALDATAEEAGGATVIEADLTDPESLAKLCEEVKQSAPTLDVIVHNAGVGIVAFSYETNPEPARRMLDLNLLAPIELTRRLLPRVPRGGTVVTISSIAGKVPVPGISVYSASKHALTCFADLLSIEIRDRGINVLNVCPGYVRTGFSDRLLQGPKRRNIATPRRFSISADQCAEAVVAGVLRRKRTVVVPWFGWIMVLFDTLFPSLVRALIWRFVPKKQEV